MRKLGQDVVFTLFISTKVQIRDLKGQLRFKVKKKIVNR